MKTKEVEPKEVFGRFPEDEMKFVGEDIAVMGDKIIAHSRNPKEFYGYLFAHYSEAMEQIVVHKVLSEEAHVL